MSVPPVADPDRTTPNEPPVPQGHGLPPGRRVGPWRIVALLGAGGMGTVHLAERDDGAFRTQAALKLLNPWLIGQNYEARFERERQLLADLRHPSIANLIDGGVTEEGVPYFVLEYVDGCTITEYARQKALSLRDRLELFHKICLAVQHAHQNLVVHRDIKPGNVLVTPDGEPKLLDFGIAKLLDERTGRSHDDSTLAGGGTLLLTPGYASPEQRRGEPVSTASDVYALGVVLYELLVGERPPQPNIADRSASPPTRPSSALARLASAGDDEAARVDRKKRIKALRGDVDVIVLKALAYEPKRRYASAQHLADDIARHLEHRPVRARPDSLGYRISKFAQRHPWALATGVLGLLSITVAAIAFAVLSVQLRAERDRATAAQAQAERAARTAQRTADFMASLFESSDPRNSGGRMTAHDLLQAGYARVGTELAQEPETLAYLLNVIGGIQRQLDLLDDSERSLTRAVALRREKLGPGDRLTAESMSELADVYRMQARFDESEKMQRETLAIRRKLDPPDPKGVGQSLNNLALVLKEGGHLAEAKPLYVEAIAERERDFGHTHQLTMISLINLGMLENDLGELDAAERDLREVYDVRRAQLGEEHVSTSNAMLNLGRTYELRGRYDEAERWIRRSLEVRQKLLAPEHGNVTGSQRDLARVLEEQGRLEEAEALYRAAFEVEKRVNPPDSPITAKAAAALARTVGLRGHGDDAEAMMRPALATMRKGFGADHPSTARVEFDLAELLLARGNAREALPLLESALATRRAKLPAGHRDIGWTLLALARAQRALGAADGAAKSEAEGRALLERALPPNHPDRARIAA